MMNWLFNFAVELVVVLFVGLFFMWVSSLLYGSWPTGHLVFLFFVVSSVLVGQARVRP